MSDTRRYGWAVGALAAVLVIGFLIYTLTSHHPSGTPGVPAGGRLHLFSAPLAASTLNGDANLNPPCTLARHDPRALNVCLLAKRAPLVLAFFVTNSSQCEREVDTMQALARRREMLGAQFAAIAVNSSHAAAGRAVRAHGWTIPVAYDADGAVAGLYGVTACPLLELADRGGTVAQRLIGQHWLNEGALAGRVEALLAPAGATG
ncbi:MAG: TlpA family protein disulfide reductase [Solirubrobacterales bacterium]|nr:TlpA family protein disulfide reductase [Solirubrobacterales bacterium]